MSNRIAEVDRRGETIQTPVVRCKECPFLEREVGGVGPYAWQCGKTGKSTPLNHVPPHCPLPLEEEDAL